MSAKVKPIINREKVEARIAELEQQRTEFLAEANKQIAMVNAAIGELRALLGEEAEQEEED